MSWWRTQRLALGGLLVAALAAGGAHYWFQVLPMIEKEGPVYVTPDGTAELGGHRLELSSVRWDEFEAPAGSTTLSVRLRAQSDAETELCGSFTLTEVNGGRVWLDAHGDVDVTSDDERSCQEDSASYSILAVFLLPDDASGPFWFDMPIVGDPEVLRLRLEG